VSSAVGPPQAAAPQHNYCPEHPNELKGNRAPPAPATVPHAQRSTGPRKGSTVRVSPDHSQQQPPVEKFTHRRVPGKPVAPLARQTADRLAEIPSIAARHMAKFEPRSTNSSQPATQPHAPEESERRYSDLPWNPSAVTDCPSRFNLPFIIKAGQKPSNMPSTVTPPAHYTTTAATTPRE